MSNNLKGPPVDFFEFPKKTGWLTKQGGSGLKVNWRRRYVVLDHHYLFYYKSDKDRAPCGNICLPDYDIVARADTKECKKPNAFMITSSDNIGATNTSDCKRVYYMYADTEGECVAWSVAIQEQMIAIIDPKQKHYFTLQDMGLHSTNNNGYQDNGANFDDLTTVVEDGQKLEHVTAQRPKKPYTRAPSRGNKDLNAFDEDDISTFALSPVSTYDEPTHTERKAIQKKVSPLTKPMKPLVPPSETQSKLQERPNTKPKPAVKPKNLMKSSISTDSSVPQTRKLERTQQKSVDHELLSESTPVPTPRRTAPSIPDSTNTTSRISILPPTPPEHSSRSLPAQQEITSPLQQQEVTPLQDDIVPLQDDIAHLFEQELTSFKHEFTPPNEQEIIAPLYEQELAPIKQEVTPIKQELAPSYKQEVTPIKQEVTPSYKREVAPPICIRKSLSLSSSSSHSLRGSNHNTNTFIEATRLSGSQSNRYSSSSSSSSNGSTDNVYQVPRDMDPIYQIPTSTPIQIQPKQEEFPAKIPVRKLHSVGYNISTSPRLSVDSPNYSNIVTDYLCSSPNLNTPPTSPTPPHKAITRNDKKSVTLPRHSTISFTDSTEARLSRKLSSGSNHSANSTETNNTTTESEASDRILSQIRELEDQLISLTTSSPRRGSLSPYLSQSNPVSQMMNSEAQKLIDNMRIVVYEAISFHKQASEELQLARTEKKIAEKARQDAELNTQNIQTLLSSFQQQRTPDSTF